MSGDAGSVNEISGGEFFSAVVQARDIETVTLQLPARVPEALSGLPPGSLSFTGREEALQQVLDCLTPKAPGDAAVVVAAAVGGMGGIGKTELAIQAARTALRRGWFPGGVLFVNMFGYDPDPARRLEAGHALEGFLRAVGVPGEHIPAGVEDRARLLRSVMAAYAGQGRRVLMVIDNVAVAEQARPLLPSDGVCAAIVTSRHTLADLDARLLNLDILSTEQAVDLLDAALTLRDPRDTRIRDQPDNARRLAALCGGLPLALQITAAMLAANSAKPVATMADDLANTATRLEEMNFANWGVGAVFDTSYQELSDDQARLFRLLSVNPGPDICTAAAAALAGWSEIQARRVLESLARAHLIEPGSVYGRWQMHDLMRLHSTHHGHRCAASDQRDQALTRLLNYYLVTTQAATARLVPVPGNALDPASFGFATPQETLAWLDAEFSNLTAAVYTAATHPDHKAVAFKLPTEMWEFLIWRRHYNDWILLFRTALSAAQDLGDEKGQADTLNALGIGLSEAGRFEEAVIAHQTAADIHRKIGHFNGQGSALVNLGCALLEMGRYEDAITAEHAATQVFRKTGNRVGEGNALIDLGRALRKAGRLKEAITAHQTGAEVLRDTSYIYGEGTALDEFGCSLVEAGRFQEAITAHHAAVRIFREIDNRHSLADALIHLGTALLGAGRLEEAVKAYQAAAKIFHEVGDLNSETQILKKLQETKHTRASPERGA
jgi:tetratricopeptide (TPR) repeat protein